MDNIKETPAADREQLANLSFAWMVDRIQPYLAIDFDAVKAQFDAVKGLDKMQSVSGGVIKRYVSPLYAVIAGGLKPRTPGHYHNNDTTYTVERIHPSVYFRQQWNRHQSGIGCLDGAIYQPEALKGWSREYVDDGSHDRRGWVWRKRDKSGAFDPADELWEFQIGEMPRERSAERLLFENSWDSIFLREVDEGWREEAED